MTQHLQGGARHGSGVDAVMLVEPPVLEGEQHLEIALIDVAGIERQAPAAIGCRERPQQPLVAIDDHDGKLLGFGQRQRPDLSERLLVERIAGCGQNDGNHGGCYDSPLYETAALGHVPPPLDGEGLGVGWRAWRIV